MKSKVEKTLSASAPVQAARERETGLSRRAPPGGLADWIAQSPRMLQQKAALEALTGQTARRQQGAEPKRETPLNQPVGVLQLMRINTYRKDTHEPYSFDTKDLTQDQIRQAFHDEVEKDIYENALRIGTAYNRGDYFMTTHERLTWAAMHLPQLRFVDLGGFQDLMQRVSEKVGLDRWNEGVGSASGIGTDEMGTCLSVGLTARGPHGQKVSGLVHDVPIGNVLSGYASTVIGWLQGAFNGQNALPAFNQLTQVRYFVVGGHPETGANVAAIVTELVSMGVDIAGVALTTAPTQNELVKGVVVLPGGEIFYTAYENKTAKPAEDTLSKFGGFTFGKRPDGGSGGFKKPGRESGEAK
jgi:hypothetical protein